ncbi:PH domain-containing protein [Clostridium sp. 19966]|uniref:PH domain-containing protein n=1 Tax=Clostridium sp. 19966 TaxID=2768166 RepID=UPI0028E055E1|nr:PH domain-containing protein [Clostridium sp. 19966]MDT8716774.1 PH domain-containing protein [Clostridium sp. 19966]
MEWNDRKRILGLPISFTRYKLEGTRLYVSKGLFNTVEDELVMYRVLDVRLSRSLLDKIFRVGTITLYTADETDRELLIEKVKNPKQVRDLISKLAEDERGRLNIKGKELYGAADIPIDFSDNNQL